jgi:hypothetical protein
LAPLKGERGSPSRGFWGGNVLVLLVKDKHHDTSNDHDCW